MVQGGFIALLWSRIRRSRFLAMLAVAHFAVMVLAVSASALFAAAAAWLCLVLFERRVRRPLLGFGAFVAAAVALLLVFGRDLAVAASWITNLSERFTLRQAVDVATRTPVEVFAQFLDIFDYTAFMVLAASPLAVLIGVGPGLVMLPGSAFIPSDPRWAWVVETNEGITSLPTMGILVEWSNGGILMVLLWIAFAVACWRAFSDMAELDPATRGLVAARPRRVRRHRRDLPGADVSHLGDLAGVHGNGDRRRRTRPCNPCPRSPPAARLAFQGGE